MSGQLFDLSAGDAASFEIRAQVHEAWDAIRVRVAASTQVHAVKRLAIGELLQGTADVDDYMCKLYGVQLHDESLGVSASGLRSGSMLLMHTVQRRPLR